MTPLALALLQYGLAFVFVWTGVLILKDTAGWAQLIEKSWVRGMLFGMSPQMVMRLTAVFDIAVGVWLALGVWLWIPAALAALHLLSVLMVAGIFKPTYRDVGLFAMALALAVETYPGV